MNQFKNIYYSLLLFLCLSGLSVPSSLKAQINVVFDLGGVFFDRSYKRICSHVGFSKLVNLVLRGKNVRKILFNALNEIELPGEITDTDRLACDDAGRPLSKGLIHWIKGNASGREIIDAIEKYYDEESCCGKTEMTAISRMVEAIFDPELFAQTTVIYQQMLDFLQECIDQGHNTYILSNLDVGSFQALREMLPGFFELFDGVVISAKVKLMKPNPAIFSYVLDTYNLKPEETVFIDDQQENLDAAEALGIFPIRCGKSGWLKKSPNIKKIRKALDEWQEEREDNSSCEYTFCGCCGCCD